MAICFGPTSRCVDLDSLACCSVLAQIYWLVRDLESLQWPLVFPRLYYPRTGVREEVAGHTNRQRSLFGYVNLLAVRWLDFREDSAGRWQIYSLDHR